MAAGLEKAIEHPWDPSDAWTAVALAGGVPAFVACEVGFRRTFGITRSQVRLGRSPGGVLRDDPAGTEVG